MSRQPHASPVSWDGEFAGLAQQVAGLENDYRDLKIGVINLDKKIDNSFKSLSEKFDQRALIQWGPIWTGLGVAVTVLALIGGTIGSLALRTLDSEIASHASEQRYQRERLDKYATQIDRLTGALNTLGAVATK